MELFKGDKLLTAAEVASILKVSISSVRSWVRQREIPYLKLITGEKGTVRFSPAQLNGWLEDREKYPSRKYCSSIESRKSTKSNQQPVTQFDEFLENLEV